MSAKEKLITLKSNIITSYHMNSAAKKEEQIMGILGIIDRQIIDGVYVKFGNGTIHPRTYDILTRMCLSSGIYVNRATDGGLNITTCQGFGAVKGFSKKLRRKYIIECYKEMYEKNKND